MQSHLNKSLRLDHELTRETEHKVRTVTALLLLHLGGHGDHFGRWMMDITFLDDCGSIRSDEKSIEVIDHHFVHTVRSQSRLGHAR